MQKPTVKRYGRNYRYVKSGRFAPAPSLTPALGFLFLLIATLAFGMINAN